MNKLILASCVLLTALGLTSLARTSLGEDPAPWTVAIESRYTAQPTLEVPIQEISGLSVLPSSTSKQTSLLVVTDEGPYDPEEGVVRGALFRLDLRHDEKGTHIEGHHAIDLRVRFGRFDPGWPATISPMDLESVAAVPGTSDLFLLAGERNPEDQTDDGANRFYLVQYPVGSDAHAKVIRYTRIFDLVGDSMNDRFEALALLPAKKGDGEKAWSLYALKERIADPDAVPGYVHGSMASPANAYEIQIKGDRGYPPLIPAHLATKKDVVANQCDACVTPEGDLWILDRWLREIHVARPNATTGELDLVGHLDTWNIVKSIPGEVTPGAPSAPGRPEREGYGRHEGLALDAQGRVYLATDRGGGTTSTLTVLVPIDG